MAETTPIRGPSPKDASLTAAAEPGSPRGVLAKDDRGADRRGQHEPRADERCLGSSMTSRMKSRIPDTAHRLRWYPRPGDGRRFSAEVAPVAGPGAVSQPVERTAVSSEMGDDGPRAGWSSSAVNQQLLNSLPIPVLVVVVAAIMLIAYEIGFRVGRWWQDKTPDESEGPGGVLVGSLLGLLAFMLAITMGMASDRFDTRRGLVLAEANAIWTTYQRAGYQPEPQRAQVRELLTELAGVRIATSDRDAARREHRPF